MGGKPEEAKQKAHAALAIGSSSNEVLDAMIEGVNILVDLNEIGGCDQTKLAATENAVGACLQVLEESLKASESRFNVTASVGPIGIRAGGLLSVVISALFRSVGFKSMTLSKTKTALDLLRNSEELGVDLVVPLLANENVDAQIQSLTDEIDLGGFKTRFKVIPVVLGLTDDSAEIRAARSPEEAVSQAIEWAIKRSKASCQN